MVWDRGAQHGDTPPEYEAAVFGGKVDYGRNGIHFVGIWSENGISSQRGAIYGV